MKYNQILTEMAFSRKRIIRALESYDTRIFEHSMKIILMPDSQDNNHWRNELLAWCEYLAELRLKIKNNPPMGFDLAYEYLYRGPFEGNEIGMTKHFVRVIQTSYKLTNDVDLTMIHQRLKVFLTQLSHDIGAGTDVTETINSL